MLATKVSTTMSQDRIDRINDAIGAVVPFACRPFGVNLESHDLVLASVSDWGAKMTRFEYRAFARRMLTVDHEAGWLDISLIRPDGKGVKFVHVARFAV